MLFPSGNSIDSSSNMRMRAYSFERMYQAVYEERRAAFDNFIIDFTNQFFVKPGLLKNSICKAIREYQGKIQQSLRYRIFKKAGFKRSNELLNKLNGTEDNQAILALLLQNLREGNEDKDSFTTVLYDNLVSGFRHRNWWSVNKSVQTRKWFIREFAEHYNKEHTRRNIEMKTIVSARR